MKLVESRAILTSSRKYVIFIAFLWSWGMRRLPSTPTLICHQLRTTDGCLFVYNYKLSIIYATIIIKILKNVRDCKNGCHKSVLIVPILILSLPFFMLKNKLWLIHIPMTVISVATPYTKQNHQNFTRS